MQNHVLDYLDSTVKRVPDKIAFANENEALTFRQVYDQNRALASFFVNKRGESNIRRTAARRQRNR